MEGGEEVGREERGIWSTLGSTGPTSEVGGHRAGSVGCWAASSLKCLNRRTNCPVVA